MKVYMVCQVGYDEYIVAGLYRDRYNARKAAAELVHSICINSLLEWYRFWQHERYGEHDHIAFESLDVVHSYRCVNADKWVPTNDRYCGLRIVVEEHEILDA